MPMGSRWCRVDCGVGIKKGIVEVADVVVVNKCDGDLVPAARRIQTEYASALKFVRPKTRQWRPQVSQAAQNDDYFCFSGLTQPVG